MKFPRYSELEIVFPVPILKTTRTFKKVDFDLLHSHTMFTMGMRAYIMSKLFSKPLLGSFHTLISKFSKYLTKKFEGRVKRLSWLSSRWYYDRRCDAFTVPTDSTKSVIRKYGFENKIYTLPNGISSEIEGEIRPEEIREKHGISEDDEVVLYFGRLSIEKRVEDAIKAMEHLGDDKVLLICGRGPYGSKLKKLASKTSGRIIFTGYVPESLKASYYAAGDVFVFPSVGDTQGIVLLEAMKYGLPIVSVKAQGIVDIVKNDENGLLAEAKNPKNLAEKIKSVLEDDDIQKNFLEKNKEVVRRHSWEKTTDKLENIYEKITGG